MNPQLAPLIELQTLDLRITTIKEQQSKNPALLNAAGAPLKDAQQALKDAQATLEALSRQRRDKEHDLEFQEGHIGKLRGRLSELKTNKEYQAALFEIEMANKKKGELEEQALQVMDRIEKLQAEIAEIQTRAAEAERAFQTEQARIQALSAELEGELAELEEKHRQVAAAVEPRLIERYKRIKAMRKDLAVVPVQNGTCSGCRLQIQPQLVAEVKRAERLLECTWCHRILYWESGPSAAEDEKTPTSEASNPA